MSLAALPLDVLVNIFSFIPLRPRLLVVSVLNLRIRHAVLCSVTFLPRTICPYWAKKRFPNLLSLRLDTVASVCFEDPFPLVGLRHLFLRQVPGEVMRGISSLRSLVTLTAYLGNGVQSDASIFALLQSSAATLTSLSLSVPEERANNVSGSQSTSYKLIIPALPYCPNLKSLSINSEKLSQALYLHATQLTSLTLSMHTTLELQKILTPRGNKNFRLECVTHLDWHRLPFARYDNTIFHHFPALRTMRDSCHISAFMKLTPSVARSVQSVRLSWLHSIRRGSLDFAECFAHTPHISSIYFDAERNLPILSDLILSAPPSLCMSLTSLAISCANEDLKDGEVQFLKALPHFRNLRSLALRAPSFTLPAEDIIRVTSVRVLRFGFSTGTGTSAWNAAQAVSFAMHFPRVHYLHLDCTVLKGTFFCFGSK